MTYKCNIQRVPASRRGNRVFDCKELNRLLTVYVLPVFRYGAETWTKTKASSLNWMRSICGVYGDLCTYRNILRCTNLEVLQD